MHEKVEQMLIEAGSQEGRGKILSLRDQFAALSLQGLFASCDGRPSNDKELKIAARFAYKAADAMIVARDE